MRRSVMLLLVLTMLCSGCSQPEPAGERISPFGQMAEQRGDVHRVVADNPVILPEDHASHPGFSLEWWYFTATLRDTRATPYGLQFTLFRLRQPTPQDSEWSDNQRWLAHTSLHNPDTHYFEEKIARGGVGNAGVTSMPFRAFIDDWQWQASDAAPAGEMFPGVLTTSVNDNAHARLSLATTGPPVLHGEHGYSEKSADGNFRSYYYSQPFIQVSGTLTLSGKKVAVTGNGWFDHEWTSQLASDKALGWDWLSLSLDDGRKLMAFNMYVAGSEPYTTGTLISPQGDAQTLDADAITLAPTGYEDYEGKQLPVNWALSVPSAGIDIDIKPFKQGQWNPGLVSYYEGRVEGKGSHNATGFLELTGY